VFEMRRQILTKNLLTVIDRLQNIPLPADVDAVLIHGSYVRGEGTPGDMDVVMVATAKAKWGKHFEALQSLSEIHSRLLECWNKGMSLGEAARGPLRTEIEGRGVPYEWVSTSNWSELWGSTAPYVSYVFDWDRITRRLLTKGMKGVHIQTIPSRGWLVDVTGRLFLLEDMPLYGVWLSEAPSIVTLEPTPEEFDAYLKLEYQKLQRDRRDG